MLFTEEKINHNLLKKLKKSESNDKKLLKLKSSAENLKERKKKK